MREQSGIDAIRDAFRYQNRFNGSTMVFKVDFPVTEDSGFAYLIKDLALLVKSGIKAVVVPGCSEWINTTLKRQNIALEYAGDERITTEEALPFVEMAAFHAATRFMTGFSGSRVEAVAGNFVRARGRGVIGGVDRCFTGEVDKVYAASLRRLLDCGAVPVLPCIGWSPAGKAYNVSSDEIALAVSKALGALKLIIVSDGPFPSGEADGGWDASALPSSIERDADGRIIRLKPAEAARLLALAPQAKAAGKGRVRWPAQLGLSIRALEAGVERVHLINGREEGALLREIFSNMGSGTMVYAGDQEHIRPLKNADISDVLHLMEPFVRQEMLLRRSAVDIQEKKDDYVALELDGSIRACAALHDWGGGQGEIAALAADAAFSAMGLGRRLVDHLIGKARRTGLRRVFVLTTRAQDWFEAYGFSEAPVESLPERKRALYNTKRKSKVFALDL